MDHGSIVYDYSLNIYQVIGIPHPIGKIPVIPKYTPCSDGVWRLGVLRYCRVIKEYGPYGLNEALARSGFIQEYDPMYASAMPYLSRFSILKHVDPHSALKRVINGSIATEDPILLDVVKIADVIVSEAGIELNDLGLTGSVAAGIAVSEISDIDLVVYGLDNAVLAYDFFKRELRMGQNLRTNYGGVVLLNVPQYSWRRGTIKGIGRQVSWVGVPRHSGLCDAMKRYNDIDPPSRVWSGYVRIEGGQPTALVYPPCVLTREDFYIVSFEYNVAYLLYEGGRFRVDGVMGEYGSTIYVGLREYPGSISAGVE